MKWVQSERYWRTCGPWWRGMPTIGKHIVEEPEGGYTVASFIIDTPLAGPFDSLLPRSVLVR